MSILCIIAAMDRNMVIDNSGDLLWRIPSDLRRFRKMTSGHTVVMGRKTYESIVKRLGKPLPERHNVILTRQRDFVAEGCVVAHSIDKAVAEADGLCGGETFVIGGAEIFNLALPYTERMFLTRVDAEVEGSVTFPKFNENMLPLVSREQLKQKTGDEYATYLEKYERVPFGLV